MKTFTFYVVLSAAIVVGILAIAREAHNPSVAAPLTFLLAFLSFIFWELNQCNRQMIKPGKSQALPFADGVFDSVICQLGLMFFTDPGRGLEEFRRVLRSLVGAERAKHPPVSSVARPERR